MVFVKDGFGSQIMVLALMPNVVLPEVASH